MSTPACDHSQKVNYGQQILEFSSLDDIITKKPNRTEISRSTKGQ